MTFGSSTSRVGAVTDDDRDENGTCVFRGYIRKNFKMEKGRKEEHSMSQVDYVRTLSHIPHEGSMLENAFRVKN